MGEDKLLPKQVEEWVGVTKGYDNIVYINDVGATFQSIAEVIEREWEKL